MGADNFTGIVSCLCKQGHITETRYTIIQAQCPKNYVESFEHFKSVYDPNELNWINSKTQIYETAKLNEELCPTQHGIVKINYTKEEILETKIMFSSEYKKLNGIKNAIYIIFNFTTYLIYLLFMIKLYSNLHY